MVEIMNRLRQPLVLNLNSGKSLHLKSREKKKINNDELKSKEIKNHLDKGNIIVLKMD